MSHLGGLRTEQYLSADNKREDDSRTKHEPPTKIQREAAKGNAHDVAKHNAKGRHICHIMTKAPLIGAGAHSAA